MDRSTKLAILQAASDESLDMALDAMGIPSGSQDEYGEGPASSGGLPIWNHMTSGVKSSTRPPIVDKAAAFAGARDQQRDTDTYGFPMSGAGDDDEAALSAGLL